MMQIRMRPLILLILTATAAVPESLAQQTALERLPARVLDVVPPSARVRGTPGQMALQARPCRVLPTENTRRRIVDIAIQEWGFFGFPIVDRTVVDEIAGRQDESRGADTPLDPNRDRRRRPRLSPDEAARVASSIGGYWAVTPEGSWIVARQNDAWNGPDGTAARWNAPWSAAFISWVMCEAGLGDTTQFRRAIAHHAYIDQAIRARATRVAQAAFVAYDMGEAAVTPGDLLCSSRRPVYRTIGDRRRQSGVGARTHCDIVVRIDEARQQILAIGGNVRGTVSLKLLPAQGGAGKPMRVVDPDEQRPIFAHLKLRADSIEADPLSTSATIKALGCHGSAALVQGALQLVKEKCLGEREVALDGSGTHR
jgi:hypothetical protein